jgi:hypothetical protein
LTPTLRAPQAARTFSEDRMRLIKDRQQNISNLSSLSQMKFTCDNGVQPRLPFTKRWDVVRLSVRLEGVLES